MKLLSARSKAIIACVAFGAIAAAVWCAPRLWVSGMVDESATVRVWAGDTIKLRNGLEIKVTASPWPQPLYEQTVSLTVGAFNRSRAKRFVNIANAAVLVDDRGKIYRCVSWPGDASELAPLDEGGYTGARLMFEKVPAGWKKLSVRLPAASFGARGVLELELAAGSTSGS